MPKKDEGKNKITKHILQDPSLLGNKSLSLLALYTLAILPLLLETSRNICESLW